MPRSPETAGVTTGQSVEGMLPMLAPGLARGPVGDRRA